MHVQMCIHIHMWTHIHMSRHKQKSVLSEGLSSTHLHKQACRSQPGRHAQDHVYYTKGIYRGLWWTAGVRGAERWEQRMWPRPGAPGRAKVCGSGGSEVRFVNAQGKDEGRRSAQSHTWLSLWASGNPRVFFFYLWGLSHTIFSDSNFSWS